MIMTDQQQRDLAICRLLAGPYYGRTVRECCDCRGSGYREYSPELSFDEVRKLKTCPECNGTGEVFREWLVCPKCNGKPGLVRTIVAYSADEEPCDCDEGRIPDDDGRAVIAEAMQTLPETTVDEDFWHGFDESPLRSWEWMWNHRDKVSGLEATVRNYQQPPTDLRANDGSELKRLLLEADMGLMFRLNRTKRLTLACGLVQNRLHRVKATPKPKRFTKPLNRRWRGGE